MRGIGLVTKGLKSASRGIRKATASSRRAMGPQKRLEYKAALKAGKEGAKKTFFKMIDYSPGEAGGGSQPGQSGPLGIFGGALAQGSVGAASVPPPSGMQSGKKARRITNPTISSISKQLTDILNAIVELRNIAIDRINTQSAAYADAARVAKESIQESSYNPAEQQAQRVDSKGVDIAPLEETFKKFGKALDDLIKLLEGKVGPVTQQPTSDSGSGLDITDLPVPAAALGAAAATGGILLAIDQGAKAIQGDAQKQAEALKPLGMEPVYNEQGFTKGWKIQGKVYTNEQVNSDPKLEWFKNARDAYGPGADPRWANTSNARAWLKKNPNPPDLNAKPGAQSAQAQPTQGAMAQAPAPESEEIVVTASKKKIAAAKQDAVQTKATPATAAMSAPGAQPGAGAPTAAPMAAAATGAAAPMAAETGQAQATMESGAPPTAMAAAQSAGSTPVPGEATSAAGNQYAKEPPKPKSVGDIISERMREARQRMRVVDLTGQQAPRNRPLPSTKPTERAGYVGTGNVPDPNYYNAGNLTAQLYTVRM